MSTKLVQIQTRLTHEQIDWLDKRAEMTSSPTVRMDRSKLLREAVEVYRRTVSRWLPGDPTEGLVHISTTGGSGPDANPPMEAWVKRPVRDVVEWNVPVDGGLVEGTLLPEDEEVLCAFVGFSPAEVKK